MNPLGHGEVNWVFSLAWGKLSIFSCCLLPSSWQVVLTMSHSEYIILYWVSSPENLFSEKGCLLFGLHSSDLQRPSASVSFPTTSPLAPTPSKSYSSILLWGPFPRSLRESESHTSLRHSHRYHVLSPSSKLVQINVLVGGYHVLYFRIQSSLGQNMTFSSLKGNLLHLLLPPFSCLAFLWNLHNLLMAPIWVNFV